jgi:hypothetical protein
VPDRICGDVLDAKQFQHAFDDPAFDLDIVSGNDATIAASPLEH